VCEVRRGGSAEGVSPGFNGVGTFSGGLTLEPGEGAFVPRGHSGGALSGCTLISVVVQNFGEIGQFAAEIWRFY